MPVLCRLALLAAALTLAACESTFEVDIVAQGFDDDRTVRLNIEGIQIEPLDDGNPRSVTRNSTLELQLAAQSPPQRTELLTEGDIPDDEYSGVRLRFETTEGSVTDSRTGSSGTFTITRASGDDPDDDPFADVAFMFEQDKDETVSLIVAIDVPLSLSFDQDNDEYTIDPVVRAMESGDEASASGTVDLSATDAECNDGGIAVYAFEGDGETPDERGGGNVEPLASAAVSETDGSFRLDFLPPGDYTLAATCEAEEDNGTEDRSGVDEIDFGDPVNLRLRAGDDEVGVELSL